MNNSNVYAENFAAADTDRVEYGMMCRMDNPMPHCPVMLVLDTSHSMWGKGLADMKASLDAFYDTLRSEQFSNAQIDIAAVSLGDRLGMLEEFTPFALSRLPQLNIRPKGDTPMGAALSLALEKIGEQLKRYSESGRSHVTPQLIMLSDGESSDDCSAVAQEIRKLAATGELVCRVIATGENPDLPALRSIAGDNVSFARQTGMSGAFAGVGKVVSQAYEEEAEAVIDREFTAQPGVPSQTGSGLVLIDGTNVMHWDKNGSGVTLKHLLAITRHLEDNGVDYKALFDANSRYMLTHGERTLFEDLLKTRPERFSQVPARTRADDFLLMIADGDPAVRIISNDMYRDYASRFPWVGDRTRFIRGMAMRDQVFLLDGEGNRTKISSAAGKSSACDLNWR